MSADPAGSGRGTAVTRHECRICWYVYDPREGDAQEQIAPGTGFADLPEHWRCPQCDAERHAFLVMED